MNVLLPAAEGAHESVIPLPMEPIWFGVITLIVMGSLLALLWGFRNTLALDPRQYHHDDLGGGPDRQQPGGAAEGPR